MAILWPRSIISQTTLWLSILMLAVFCMSILFLYRTLSSVLISEDAGFLNDRIEAVTSILTSKPEPLKSVQQRVELEWATRKSKRVYIILQDKETHEILVKSPGIPDSILKDVFPSLDSNELRSIHSSDGVYLTMQKEFQFFDTHPIRAVLFAASDLTQQENIRNKFKNAFGLTMLFFFAISVYLNHRFARMFLNPIEHMIETARQISFERLSGRIKTDQLPTELKKLGTHLNDMLDRLTDSFARLSRFSADIAHETRGPINNIQGEIEIALQTDRSTGEYKEVLGSVTEEAQRISATIDSLLFLARAENDDLMLVKERINIKEEILNLVDYFQASADELGIVFQYNISENIEIFCERTLFQRALSNIISNALKYSPKQTHIFIAAYEISETHVDIVVVDQGMGIPAEHLPFVFDRFYRVDQSRSSSKTAGVGLGLTIVKSIMTLHGGAIEISSAGADLASARGTKVTLHFPRNL